MSDDPSSTTSTATQAKRPSNRRQRSSLSPSWSSCQSIYAEAMAMNTQTSR